MARAHPIWFLLGDDPNNWVVEQCILLPDLIVDGFFSGSELNFSDWATQNRCTQRNWAYRTTAA